MKRAIVMGASVAGLCAAAALVKHYDHVLVLERDPDSGCVPRRGVPQGHHVHALLSRGQQIMNELFPGAFQRLAEAGALRCDAGMAFRCFKVGSWLAQSELGVDAWFQSRPLLESELRSSLRRNPKIELRFETPIDQPIHEDGRVHAVRLRDGSILSADLVVDATGRGSRSGKWLGEWGYGQVREQRLRLGLAYVTGIFELAPGERLDGSISVCADAPHLKRGGTVFPIEGGRAMISLIGYHGEHPPTDPEEFRAWAGTLRRSTIADFVERSTLVGKLKKFTIPEQVRRCYGAGFARWPDNYLVVGDAMCSFDPTFGQGMLVSTLQAEQLAGHARPGVKARRLQRRLLRLTALPFSLTAVEAHQWKETEGWSPAFRKLRVAYGRALFAAAGKDPRTSASLFRAMHFLAPQTELMDPRIIRRVVAEMRRHISGVQSATSPFADELSSSVSSQTGY